jgi:putative transposase
LRQQHFRTTKRLEVLHRGLLLVAEEFGWKLEAWAVLSNQYHFVGHSPDEGAESLTPMLNKLHSKTASWLNRLDKKQGRKVWHNFRETKITHPTSLLARLHYVHFNPAKHRLVRDATEYPWCSARWLELKGTSAQVRTVKEIQVDQANIYDHYSPVMPEDKPDASGDES